MEAIEKLEIKGTPSTPDVIFEPNGNMLIKGRIIPENAFQLFKPLIDWVKEINCENIRFVIDLEYLNTGATNQLFILLKTLDENPSIKDLSVIWRYDEDDEDHLETGHFYEDKLNRIKFSYTAAA
jgi:SiaC family regulatory phosphoprotein